MNIWNELVEIKNRYSNDKSVVDHADMLLRQYITAGGKEIMGHECINFIEKLKVNGNQKEN